MKPRILIDATTVTHQKDGLSEYIINLLINIPQEAFGEFELSVLINKNGLERTELLDLKRKHTFNFIEANIAPIGPKRDWNFFWFFRKQAEKFDLFHSTSNQYPLCIKGGIATIHDLTFKKYFDAPWWSFKLAQRYLHFVVKHALQQSNHVIAISAATKADVMLNYPFSGKQQDTISVIHEGWEHLMGPLDTNSVAPISTAEGQYLFYVGNCRAHKNIAHLIKAFSLVKDNPLLQKIKLVISGNTSNLDKALLQQVHAINRPHQRIIFTGAVSAQALKGLYQNADAFIFPSLAEGFGIPILESFYYQKPLLCSNTSSFPEIAGDAALYFDPTQPEAIAEAILYLYQQPLIAQELMSKGAERLKLFSWKKMADETLQLYKLALNK